MRTRFAPSPTGDLHLGGALCALAAWWLVRRHARIDANSSNHAFVIRMEDLDPPRVVAGSGARILEDLAWLGLDWDEGPNVSSTSGTGEKGPPGLGPYAQSARTPRYRAAVERLRERGLVYPCDCSRAEIARVASAPHAGEEVIYPGTCRDADPARAFKRAPALRVRVPNGERGRERIEIVDAIGGPFGHRLDEAVGDFVLERGDGVFAYQLAVVVDDMAMGITDVVRGEDLLSSTPRQVWLARELGFAEEALPRWFHLPLVVDHEGRRLEKRTPGAHVRALREGGVTAEAIIGLLAHSLGLVERPEPTALEALLDLPFEALRPRSLRLPFCAP